MRVRVFVASYVFMGPVQFPSNGPSINIAAANALS